MLSLGYRIENNEYKDYIGFILILKIKFSRSSQTIGPVEGDISNVHDNELLRKHLSKGFSKEYLLLKHKRRAFQDYSFYVLQIAVLCVEAVQLEPFRTNNIPDSSRSVSNTILSTECCVQCRQPFCSLSINGLVCRPYNAWTFSIPQATENCSSNSYTYRGQERVL